MVAVTGTGSGLDIDGLVLGLVAAEQVPAESRLNLKETNVNALISAFSATKAAVTDFESAANKLATASTFTQSSATSR